DVERPATEQEGTGVAVQLVDEVADGGIVERSPAAVGEPVARILLGATGCLHHAVEGQESLHGELHVSADDASHRFSSRVRRETRDDDPSDDEPAAAPAGGATAHMARLWTEPAARTPWPA